MANKDSQKTSAYKFKPRNRVSLYLSPVNDADLILARSQLGGKVFARVAKEALKTMSRGGYKSSYLAKARRKLNPSACKGRFKAVRTIIDLSTDKDLAVILGNAKPRKSGAVIKAALRFGLGSAYTIGCLLEGDEDFSLDFEERGLFFLANVPQVVAVGAIAKEEIRGEKKETKVTPKEESTPISFPQAPASVGTVSNSDFSDTSDDDILDMLDNM